MEKEEGRERIGTAVSVNGELEGEELNVGKLGGDLVEKEEEEEEEKIDKFYALIRNFREARNRRRNELIMISNNHDHLEMIRKKNKRKYCNCNESSASSWTPTFELEDFMQDYFIKKPHQIFPPPCKKQEEDRDENGLYLKLTL